MIKLPCRPTAYFDIDDTLITKASDSAANTVWIAAPGQREALFRPITRHIAALKLHKTRGHQVVVWSQGGSDWAEAVVKALKLEEYVDLIVPKPGWFFDDLRPEEFMDRRFYFGLGEE